MDYASSRADGTRILEYTHRGLRHVRMENDLLQVTVLLDKGADIIEFLYKKKDIELMHRMPGGIRETAKFIPTCNSATGAFFDYYPGGWQVALPGGNPRNQNGAETGLHGEACCLAWEFVVLADSADEISVLFQVDLIRFPFRVERILTMQAGQAKIAIKEKITNLSSEPIDYLWGQHMAYGQALISGDTTIELPAKHFQTSTFFATPKPLFPLDFAGNWPLEHAIDGRLADLSKVSPLGEPYADFMYLKDLAEGKYTLKNQNKQIGFSLTWDLKVFPYITYINVTGGLSGYPFYGRSYFIGLELWNSFSDQYAEAKANGSLQTLKPHEEKIVEMQAEVFEL